MKNLADFKECPQMNLLIISHSLLKHKVLYFDAHDSSGPSFSGNIGRSPGISFPAFEFQSKGLSELSFGVKEERLAQ